MNIVLEVNITEHELSQNVGFLFHFFTLFTSRSRAENRLVKRLNPKPKMQQFRLNGNRLIN